MEGVCCLNRKSTEPSELTGGHHNLLTGKLGLQPVLCFSKKSDCLKLCEKLNKIVGKEPGLSEYKPMRIKTNITPSKEFFSEEDYAFVPVASMHLKWIKLSRFNYILNLLLEEEK